jgi:putative flippase GtrA
MVIEKLKIFLTDRSLRRYIIIGLSAFATDYLILTFCFYVFSINLSLAASAGFLAGFLVSFALNRWWVFGSAGSVRSTHRQVAEYTALLIFNYFFTVIGVNWLNEVGVEPSFGKIILMAFITCWNYIIFKKIIFADNSTKKA